MAVLIWMEALISSDAEDVIPRPNTVDIGHAAADLVAIAGVVNINERDPSVCGGSSQHCVQVRYQSVFDPGRFA